MRVHEKYSQLMKDQRDFFNELITEEWWDYHHADWDTTRRYEVACLFGEIQPETILDLGCGCGFHDQVMAEYAFVREVHAVDYSPKSIEKANEAYPHPKVARWCADFAQEPLSGSYDCVTSFQVIEHLEDPKVYFHAAKSVCKPGGHIAVFTPNLNRLSNLLLRLRCKPAVFCDSQHFIEYTPSSLRDAGKECGLTPVAFFGYTLAGLRWIDTQPMEKRLRWGQMLPKIASHCCPVKPQFLTG